MFKAKFFSNDAGRVLDVTDIDLANNRFAVKYDGRKVTLDNIDNLLLDTGDELIKFSELGNRLHRAKVAD